MTKRLTNQDIYTRTLKSIVSKKNTILVIPPEFVELLHSTVKWELRYTKEELSKDLQKEDETHYKKRKKMLEELNVYIRNARREAKQTTEIDHLITKVAVWPEKDELTK